MSFITACYNAAHQAYLAQPISAQKEKQSANTNQPTFGTTNMQNKIGYALVIVNIAAVLYLGMWAEARKEEINFTAKKL